MKEKERSFKAAREKKILNIMEDSGFLGRNLQDRRKWNDIFKVLSKRKILLNKNTLSGKVLLQKWMDKDYRLSPPPKKQNLRQFVNTRPSLEEMPKSSPS